MSRTDTNARGTFTFFPTLLARAVDVVFQLDADLPLGRLISNERVLQQLLSGWAARVRLHQAALDKVDELFGPERRGKALRYSVYILYRRIYKSLQVNGLFFFFTLFTLHFLPKELWVKKTL